MTRFREFAFSPYFNKHQGVRTLVHYCSSTYPIFDEKKYERKVLFAAIFPNQSFEQSKLALVFTYTLRLLEQFIRYEESLQKGEVEQNAHLLRFLRERGASFYFKKKWKENLKGVNISNIIHHLEWTSEMDAGAIQLSRFNQDFLSEKQGILDAYFVKEKLKDACELLLRANYLKRKFEPSSTLRMVCHEVEINGVAYAGSPAIHLFSEAYKLLSTNRESAYAPLFEAVKSKAAQLKKDDLQSLYSYLQNFCIPKINQGKEPFLRHLFEIYQSQLEQSLLLVEGHLPEWHYKNIVTTGLRLDEHHWVRQFLDAYRVQLAPSVAENAYSYNLAAYFYHLRKYEDVLKLLVQVEYTDQRYNLDAKSLLLRTYFALEEEEPFLALCVSFQQYLKRNKSLTDFQRKGYVSLIKFARRLFRLKANEGYWSANKWEKEKVKLHAEISTDNTAFNLNWLREKISEIG